MVRTFMTERKRIPLGEIVPDPLAIERVMRVNSLTPSECQERARAWSEVQPSSTMYHDDDFPEDEETLYARTVFSAASAVKRTVRVQGALHSTVMQAFGHALADWREKFPGITEREVVELTKSNALGDIDVKEAIMKARAIERADVAALRPRHSWHAGEAVKIYQPRLMSQVIPSGLLHTPEYQHQRTVSGCMAACYGMIFKAIAGDAMKAPSEVAMHDLKQHEGLAFDEDVMFQSLSTALFRQKTGHIVTSRVIRGADFADIARRATQLRQRVAGATVFATAGIRNFDQSAGESLHGVLLLEATEETVTFHNPYARKHHRGFHCTTMPSDGCGAFDTLDKAEFIERWAASMHDARLVIARPEPTSIA